MAALPMLSLYSALDEHCPPSACPNPIKCCPRHAVNNGGRGVRPEIKKCVASKRFATAERKFQPHEPFVDYFRRACEICGLTGVMGVPFFLIDT